MRIAEVIGTVCLSRCHPSVQSLRWVIGVPLSLNAVKADGPGDGEDQIICDQLGAGFGQRIGFSEGAEAAAPFSPEKKPVDAYCGLILDTIAISSQLTANSRS